MCGIYGQLNFRQVKNNILASEKAVDTLLHRGPDERGSWYSQTTFLGMRRLSIIDLSGGHQPIWNEDNSCCVIYNGELYNFLDLRPELEAKGHVFRTRSDTEVILHAYEEWGTYCLSRLNGMFAIAIWDERAQTLLLARDRVGEKPLYYYQDNQRLLFASEIKAILANPIIERRLNLDGLANFLAFGHANAPTTIYQNIYKLLPGHYLYAKQEDVQVRSYWDVGAEPQLPTNLELTETEYAAHIRELLDDSVRRRMIADVPVGAFLSGGVDSSAVVALMKRHTTTPIKTFSLGFAVGGAYNELSDARQVATYLGTEHHELNVHHVDLVQILRTLVYHYDEPFGDAAGFPIYLLSKAAREQVKVVLTGDGGDELFGGYRRYAYDQLAGAYQHLPRKLIQSIISNLVERLPRIRRTKRLFKTLPIVDPAKRYANWLILFTPEMQAELFNRDVYREVENYDPTWQYPAFYHRLNRSTANDHLNRLMYVDLKTWLVDVYMEKTDKATMACSLEARLPLLDHRLVELAFQIPGKYKIRGLSTKHIFREAVRSFIPDFVLKRAKHGFSVPTDVWFRGDLKQFAFEILLDEKARQRGYFNMNFVEQLWREHVQGRHVWDTHLWLLLNFELWHRIYLDQEPV